MSVNGRPLRRYLGVAVTGVIWLGFVLAIVPLRADKVAVQLALDQRSGQISGPLGISPLSIQLTSLETSPRTADSGELIFRSGAEELIQQVSIGSSVAIGDDEFEILAIRPWAGLVHRPPGTPMVNLAVKPSEGAWLENLFVERGRWRIVTTSVAIGFGATESDGARWGVVEGERMHWFNSFVPGTGVELDDGTIVTLLAHRPSARILVELAIGDAKSNQWFAANVQQDDARIRYEDPGAVPFRIELGAADDPPFIVSLLEGDLELWTRDAVLGAIIHDAETGLSLRIDQYERDGLPLFASESPWLELVLHSEDRVLRLREGEVVRIGAESVSFEAIVDPQRYRASFEIDGVDVAFDSNTVYKANGWRIELLNPTGPMAVPISPTAVTLRADYTGRANLFRVGLIVLFVLGALAYLFQPSRKT